MSAIFSSLDWMTSEVIAMLSACIALATLITGLSFMITKPALVGAKLTFIGICLSLHVCFTLPGIEKNSWITTALAVIGIGVLAALAPPFGTAEEHVYHQRAPLMMMCWGLTACSLAHSLALVWYFTGGQQNLNVFLDTLLFAHKACLLLGAIAIVYGNIAAVGTRVMIKKVEGL